VEKGIVMGEEMVGGGVVSIKTSEDNPSRRNFRFGATRVFCKKIFEFQ